MHIDYELNVVIKLPSSNVNIGLHLSIPNVELKLSTKLEVFISQHKLELNLCFVHLDCLPRSANHFMTATLPSFLNLSRAFLKVYGFVALQALQNKMYINGPGNSFLKFLLKCLQQYLLSASGHTFFKAKSTPYKRQMLL